jgi:hypothetical protein
LLPENYRIVPIGGQLLDLKRILNILGKSVKPGVAGLTLHRHGEGGKHCRENILVSVKNELDVEVILYVTVDELVRKGLFAILVNGERR